MNITQVEFNTMITCLGMTCATVQGGTGIYAGYFKKKTGLLKTNDVLFRSHRAFGSFATILYLLGLFAGITGLIGAVTENVPPLELKSASFKIHTWGSFLVLFFFVWKTWLSYFKKAPLYGNKRWLGLAMFFAWIFTWISAAVSYYERTLPSNPQHPPPSFLLPYSLFWLQLVIPFIVGGIISIFTLRKATGRDRISTTR